MCGEHDGSLLLSEYTLWTKGSGPNLSSSGIIQAIKHVVDQEDLLPRVQCSCQ